MTASGLVVRKDDESASLLDDDDMWSPVLFAGMSPPPTPPLLHGKATTKTPGHAVMKLIRSPFAAVLRMTTRARTATAITTGGEQPRSCNAAAGAVERRRPEAIRRRPSLEQLLTMEEMAAAPSPPRPHRKSKPADTNSTVKEKRAHHQKLLCESKIHRPTVAVADGERRRAVPVVKLDACGQRASAKKMVVVLESLRAPCSGDAAISVVETMMSKAKGPNGNGKFGAAGAGRSPSPGKTELFYSRPIPMGRRCRVQHLEESPYK